MTKTATKAHAFMVLLRPSAAARPADWDDTSLWSDAARIPGVEVRFDIDGAEARAFGVETSGQVLLYDQKGSLRFSGGITAARGHAGDNLGEDAIVEWINTGVSPVARGPVFGCHLFDRHQHLASLGKDSEP